MSIRPRKKVDSIISANRAYQVILNPIITEKATRLSEFNKAIFSVPLDANKIDIKSSIEKIYSVKVKSVNTILLKGCLLYTSPSPRDRARSRMPSSA